MVRTGIVLFVIAILFGLIGYVVYLKMLNNIYTNKPVITLPTPTYTSVESDNDNGTKTYTSNFMKISFDFPSSYILKDDLSDLRLTNKNGTLFFSRSGSNYSSVEDHVNSLMNTHTVSVVVKKLKYINSAGMLGISVLLSNKGVESYEHFFYKDFAVYQFETNDPALFADLDTIAKSFRILSE